MAQLKSDIEEEMENAKEFETQKSQIDGKIKDGKKAHARAIKEVMKIESAIKSSSHQKEDKVSPDNHLHWFFKAPSFTQAGWIHQTCN